jgi:hypothetical protein
MPVSKYYCSMFLQWYMTNAYRILLGEAEWKILLRRPYLHRKMMWNIYWRNMRWGLNSFAYERIEQRALDNMAMHKRLLWQKYITKVGTPQWLSVDVTSVLGWLQRVGLGHAAAVWEIHIPSMFRVEVCRVDEFLYMYADKYFVKKHRWKSTCWYRV